MIKLTSLLKQLLAEGGNVFGTSAPINKQFIEPTMDKFIATMSSIFPKKASTFKTFEMLGSAGKKEVSGDIDVAYDVKNFMHGNQPDLEGWQLDATEFQATFDQMTKKARTASPDQIMLRAMLKMIADKVNESGQPIQSDAKSAGAGSLFFDYQQYNEKDEMQPNTVQIDINVGNPEWLRFSYYSNVYKGNVKGLHRTQLLVALYGNKGKMFKHGQGIVDKETREVEAESPQDSLNLLNKIYNINITADIVNDYFKLIEYLSNNLSADDLNSVLDNYLKILDSTRADVPEDLQAYWTQHQQRLGLKGKFLPDDSKIAKYKI